MGAEEKKCECGMPLNDEAKCACNPEKCIHCCSCGAGCACNCENKCEKEE